MEMERMQARMAALERALVDVRQGNTWAMEQIRLEQQNTKERQNALEQITRGTIELDGIRSSIAELEGAQRQQNERQRLERRRNELLGDISALEARGRDATARDARVEREIDDYMHSLDENRLNERVEREIDDYMRSLDKNRQGGGRRNASMGPDTSRRRDGERRATSANPRARRRLQDNSGILQDLGAGGLRRGTEAEALLDAAHRVGIDGSQSAAVDWRNVQTGDVIWGDVAHRAKITVNWQNLNWGELGDGIQANARADRRDAQVDWREAAHRAGVNVDRTEREINQQGRSMRWVDWRNLTRRAKEAGMAQDLRPSDMAGAGPYDTTHSTLHDARAHGENELRRGRRLRRDVNAEELIAAANRVGIDGGRSTTVDWRNVNIQNVNWQDVAHRARINLNLQNMDWDEVQSRMRANAVQDSQDVQADWQEAARMAGINVERIEQQARSQGRSMSWMDWRNEVRRAEDARSSPGATNPYGYSASTAQALHPSGMADAGPYSAAQPVQEAFITAVPTRSPTHLSYNPWRT
jgi:hypothetical protein